MPSLASNVRRMHTSYQSVAVVVVFPSCAIESVMTLSWQVRGVQRSELGAVGGL